MSSENTAGVEELMPERLKSFVSQDTWTNSSAIRRESFNQLLDNPNAFLYRNRPPGDPQKMGPFTAKEEKAFIHRLNYFRRELKVENCLWGLFSVPIRGRLGYQCSSFYRKLLKDGRIQTERYEILPNGKLQCKDGVSRSVDPAVMERLEQEAFDFIKSCIASENGDEALVRAPIRAESRGHLSKQKCRQTL